MIDQNNFTTVEISEEFADWLATSSTVIAVEGVPMKPHLRWWQRLLNGNRISYRVTLQRVGGRARGMKPYQTSLKPPEDSPITLAKPPQEAVIRLLDFQDF